MKTMKYTPLLMAVAAGIMLGLLVARASLVALLPWAIVVLCPVMMLLMMRGMGHDGASRDRRDQADHDTHPQAPSGPSLRCFDASIGGAWIPMNPDECRHGRGGLVRSPVRIVWRGATGREWDGDQQ